MLFLDEPTTASTRAAGSSWGVLRDLVRDGTTLFLTTQYLDEGQLADNIMVIDHGRIIAQGTPLELKNESGAASLVVTVTRHRGRPGGRVVRSDDGEVHVDRDARKLTAAEGSPPSARSRPGSTRPHRARRLGMQRPSLDDVFLALTGHKAEVEQEQSNQEQIYGVGPMSTATDAIAHEPNDPEKPEGASRLRQILTLVRRNLTHIKRQPEMLTDVTIQPIMFVLLFAFVFGGSIQIPGVDYKPWLLPGNHGADDRVQLVHRRDRPQHRHRQGHGRPAAVAADPALR